MNYPGGWPPVLVVPLSVWNATGGGAQEVVQSITIPAYTLGPGTMLRLTHSGRATATGSDTASQAILVNGVPVTATPSSKTVGGFRLAATVLFEDARAVASGEATRATDATVSTVNVDYTPDVPFTREAPVVLELASTNSAPNLTLHGAVLVEILPVRVAAAT